MYVNNHAKQYQRSKEKEKYGREKYTELKFQYRLETVERNS